MVKRIATGFLLVGLLVLGATSAQAGGYQMVVDITNRVPTSIAGTVYGNYVPMHWDPRCIPVQFRMNNTLNPVPNPLGTAFLSLADAKAGIQQAMDAWNAIPTSYIEFSFGPDVANPGNRRFDMINEVTFRSGAGLSGIASIFPVRLVETTTFANGNDLDGDGDSDVSNAITQCTDVDSDGDIEFPEGTYDGGTVIECDIVFNTKSSPPTGLRWTVTDDIPTLTSLIDPRSLDLVSEAALQLGFAMGLTSSSLPEVNKLNNADDATMYTFRDNDDPIQLLRKRTLETDDIIAAALLYPEGSAASGPAALTGGDVAFSDRYGIIEGKVHQSFLNLPALAGNVTALSHGNPGFNDEDQVSTAYVGNARVAVNPTTLAVTTLPAAEGVVDGKYRLAVPFGTWDLNLEAVDFVPVSVASVGPVAQLGEAYGLNTYREEFWSGPGKQESAFENAPGHSVPVSVSVGNPHLTGIDFITNRTTRVSNLGPPNLSSFPDPAGTCFAVQFPITQLMAVDAGRNLQLVDAFVDTTNNDMSGLNIWEHLWLAYGTVNGTTATIDLAHPLEERTEPFGVQMFETEQWFFNRKNLLKKIFQEFEKGRQTDVFLVGKTADPGMPGFSGIPPRIVVDLRSDGFVPTGESFIATDCQNFAKDPTRLFALGFDLAETKQTTP